MVGRRTNKTISQVSTQFLYDGVNPVQELSGGTPIANLLTGLAVDEYFTRSDAAGTEFLEHGECNQHREHLIDDFPLVLE